MSSTLDAIASFSPDVRQFAFQANVLQKNVIDIYPLDAANDYSVNSSLVSHIDYESNDLLASDILFTGWCSGLREDTKQRTKRKNGDDTGVEGDANDELENFFVSVQASGKIVVFSSSGKNIVNIIQTKSEVLQASLEDSFIWTLDGEKTVKKFQYNQTKQLRSFHLVDGKDAEIVYFEILKNEGVLYLCYASNDTVYIVDPSKRRPNTVAKIPAKDCKSCELLDGNRIAIATAESVMVFDYKTGNLVQEWQMEVKRLRTIKDIILCQGLIGQIAGFKIGADLPVCQVNVTDANLLDVVRVENGIMIAWQNVNEPNFKSLTLGDLNGNDNIVIKGQTDNNTTQPEPLLDGTNENENGHIEGEKEAQAEEEEEVVPNKKITKAEQIELSRSLMSALESEDNQQILDLLVSQAWNEHKIKSFIVAQPLTEGSICKLFELVSSELQKHPWEDNEILSLWLRWLLTLRSAEYYNSSQAKHAKKHTKRLRSSLKSSGDTLPILLGIQGKLEMLKRQAQLREDLAQLNLTEGEAVAEVEAAIHDDEKEPLQASGDQNDSIVYANGESDTFVDASEFTDMK